MDGQFSIFDYIEKPTELKLGYINNETAKQLKGEFIPFEYTQQHLGELVLLEMPRYSATDYKIVLLTGFYPADSKAKDEHSRLGYSDDERRKAENSWASEMFVRGLTPSEFKYAESFYTIRR